MKRILFINNSSKLDDGTSRSLLLIVRYLHRYYEITVVSDKYSKELPDELRKYDIKHFGLNDRTLIYFPQLLLLILRRRIDLVYGNNYSGRSLIALFASKILFKPFIWHIRESFRPEKKGAFIKFANVVVANSEDTSKRIIKYSNIKSPTIINNGIDLDEYDLPSSLSKKNVYENLKISINDILVINIGRICEQKNQLDSVRVALNTLSNFPDTHFLFLGSFQDKSYMSTIYSLINASSYKNNFHFLGSVKNVVPYLFASDIMIHTAIREPQGRVIIEAMATKAPIVAFSVGGISESIISGKNGFLREQGDISGLTYDLGKLIIDKNLREEFGLAGYSIVLEKFNAEKSSFDIYELIESILK